MTSFVLPRAFAAACLGLAVVAGAAHAMGSSDSDDSVAAADPNYTAAEAAVQQEDFGAAVALLTKVVNGAPKNADAQNLLGYSYRKLGQFDSAITHYAAALDIDPKHKNAHEYIGEAYLELGDLDSAESHLKALDKICTFGCDAYRELKKAIKAYKKNLAS